MEVGDNFCHIIQEHQASNSKERAPGAGSVRPQALAKDCSQLSPSQARPFREALLAFLNFGFSICKWEQV